MARPAAQLLPHPARVADVPPTWSVPSATDRNKRYTVTWNDLNGSLRCDCPAGSYGRWCRHARAVLAVISKPDFPHHPIPHPGPVEEVGDPSRPGAGPSSPSSVPEPPAVGPWAPVARADEELTAEELEFDRRDALETAATPR